MFIPTDCVRIVSFRGIQMYNKQSKAIFVFFERISVLSVLREFAK